jgi:hypothetical protein
MAMLSEAYGSSTELIVKTNGNPEYDMTCYKCQTDKYAIAVTNDGGSQAYCEKCRSRYASKNICKYETYTICGQCGGKNTSVSMDGQRKCTICNAQHCTVTHLP